MRILVVEDDQGVREFIQEGLSNYEGFSVDVAEDRRAVGMARRAAYDIVIADMHLSEELDALTIIREITAFDRNVRFIVMTGKKRLDVATKLVTAIKGNQVASFLFKPFSLEELHIAVAQAHEGIAPPST